MRMLGCLLLLVCVSAQAGDEVYKWVDADGSIHYGNNPPKGVNARPVGGDVTVVPALKLPAKRKLSKSAGSRELESKPPSAPAAASASASSSVSPEEMKRRKLIEDCQRNSGTDCEAEIDAKLSGGGGTVVVPASGWRQPPIRPNKHASPISHASSQATGNEQPRASSSAPGKRADSLR